MATVPKAQKWGGSDGQSWEGGEDGLPMVLRSLLPAQGSDTQHSVEIVPADVGNWGGSGGIWPGSGHRAVAGSTNAL